MDCVEIPRLITEFVNQTMDEDTLENFLEHIQSCEQCKEELEVHYIMTVGLLLLDEDTIHAYNLHNEFEKHLKKEQEKVLKKKRRIIQKRVTFIIMLIVFILLSSLGIETINTTQEETTTQQNNKNMEEERVK